MENVTLISEAEARDLWKRNITNPALRAHTREVEVVMRGLASHLGRDEDLWGLTGLLHDLDYQLVGDDVSKHGPTSVKMLRDAGYDIPEMFQAILAHTEALPGATVQRETELDFGLAAADNIVGIIAAYVAMRPTRKLAGAKTSSVTKKLKDRSFVSNVNRNHINDVAKLGLERSQFIQIAIDSMGGIALELGM